MDGDSTLTSRQERRRRRRRDKRHDRRHKSSSRNREDRSLERYQHREQLRDLAQDNVGMSGITSTDARGVSCSVVGSNGRYDEQGGGKGNNEESRRPGASQVRRDKTWSLDHQGRRGSRRPKLSVPENWDDVPKMGSRIASSRFVAIRVPLDDKFSRMIKSQDELWTPETFLHAQASEGHDVRLLIDLTNTRKYYNGEEAFRNTEVKYVKLSIEGFKAPPRESEVEAFSRIVDEFITSDTKGNIAVHCTHGLNRTGYLVVSYLVQRDGMSIQEALKAFSDARPPGLIKHMYVEDLFKRFAPGATVELPELPPWAVAKYATRRR